MVVSSNPFTSMSSVPTCDPSTWRYVAKASRLRAAPFQELPITTRSVYSSKPISCPLSISEASQASTTAWRESSWDTLTMMVSGKSPSKFPAEAGAEATTHKFPRAWSHAKDMKA